ncbi:basic proline-rich protein-like [Corapipo altera]|uniref:basic proline-rich protein-like n=1 Tax=Corapipo altera TaxID=415028 RepID=UPI000FD67841|nr:basic proline-rich protein-like [Corapipo altera]
MRQGEPRRPSPFPTSCAHRAGEESRRPRRPAPPGRSFRAAEMPRAARPPPRARRALGPLPLRSPPLRPAHLRPWRRRRPRSPAPGGPRCPRGAVGGGGPDSAGRRRAAPATPLAQPPADHPPRASDWRAEPRPALSLSPRGGGSSRERGLNARSPGADWSARRARGALIGSPAGNAPPPAGPRHVRWIEREQRDPDPAGRG